MVQKPNDPKVLAEAVEALARHDTVIAAARALGLSESTFRNRLNAAALRNDWRPGGVVSPRKAKPMPLPEGDDVQRYILTCAQSGTKLHEPTWAALQALRKHYDAKLMVSTFTYVHSGEGSAKRGTEHNSDRDWYDPRIEEYVSDDMVALAPSLHWHGHLNILPTATDPLSGMDNYGGKASGIFPHTKVAMRSVAAYGGPAKLQYTTGAATQMSYIQKKAGSKAEFHHVFGGLLVEVNRNGEWWVRQIHTDSKGRIYDLDVCAMPDENGKHVVVPSIGLAAVIFGDIHVAQLEDWSRWETGGMVDTLKPALQVMHDVLDMESRGHHNRRDPHKMFALHVHGRECVKTEVSDVGRFLQAAAQFSRVAVVNSNHHRHLERWLKEADWRFDPINAEFYTECQSAYLKALRKGVGFDALKWAVQKYAPSKNVKFLAPDETLIVCRDASGGIELALHGDKGPGGAQGTLRNLARMGRKVVIGHGHAAGIFEGGYQTGVAAKLDMDYAAGAPSAWSHTDCLIYPSGKRTLVTWVGGKWRA